MSYRANPTTYVIHREPPEGICRQGVMTGMRINSAAVWMTLRAPNSRWDLCSICFDAAQRSMLYDQAKHGRPMEV